MRRNLLALAVLTLLAGCSLAPTYKRPDVGPLPAQFATQPQNNLWKVAAPADDAPRGPWWSVYDDATLDQLEKQLDQANPTLAVAMAHHDAASAFESEMRAGLFPHVGADASASRDRQSDNRPLRSASQPDEYHADTVEAGASYELDLWGRVRNQVAMGEAGEQAAAADLVSVRLSLQAQLADLYIRLCGDDVQARILDDTLDAYRQGLQLTQRRFEGGIASGLDVARAQAQLSDAMAQVSEVKAQRALVEHAIASLIGTPASSFALPAAPIALNVPAMPLGVPSTLLQRRPDIAAAERRVYAANANIGVARAAFFPSLSLAGGYGWQNTGVGPLLTAGNSFWALGPELAVSLFDGGLRRAKVKEARADFDAAAGTYKQTVLDAFEQVEDNLSLVQQLGQEAQDEDAAANAAQTSQTIATNRYREGAVSYLDVVSAQTTTLQAQRKAEQVRTRRLQASVDLIRALGGGWSQG